VARELDAAFLMGPISRPEIVNLPLSSYPLVWLASPRHGLAGKALTLEDLGQVPIITFPRHSRPYMDLEALFHGTNVRPRIHNNSSLATIVRMAADGIGVCALPIDIVRLELQRGELCLLESAVRLPDLYFTASFPGESDPSWPTPSATWRSRWPRNRCHTPTHKRKLSNSIKSCVLTECGRRAQSVGTQQTMSRKWPPHPTLSTRSRLARYVGGFARNSSMPRPPAWPTAMSRPTWSSCRRRTLNGSWAIAGRTSGRHLDRRHDDKNARSGRQFPAAGGRNLGGQRVLCGLGDRTRRILRSLHHRP